MYRKAILTADASALREKINNVSPQWIRRVLLRREAINAPISEWLLEPIDYHYRPETYWDERLRRVANIKGVDRKRDALRLFKDGRLSDASELLLAESLGQRERTLLGSLRPSLMGGEYLPDFKENEVEIARIILGSTTQDVISIRARPEATGRRIRYRIVDEYEAAYEIRMQTSEQPLSLRQLVFMIDSADSRLTGGIALDILRRKVENGDGKPEEYSDFLTFESEFYPDLARHYWFAVRRWLNAQSRKTGPCDCNRNRRREAG